MNLHHIPVIKRQHHLNITPTISLSPHPGTFLISHKQKHQKQKTSYIHTRKGKVKNNTLTKKPSKAQKKPGNHDLKRTFLKFFLFHGRRKGGKGSYIVGTGMFFFFSWIKTSVYSLALQWPGRIPHIILISFLHGVGFMVGSSTGWTGILEYWIEHLRSLCLFGCVLF